MRPGRLLALATVVLALGAYIYFVERHKPTTDELTQRRDNVFPALKIEEVQRVVVTNANGNFEIEKHDGLWKLVAPLADDADDSAVSGLLSALAALEASRTLPAKDVKAGDLGLENPALSVRFTDDKGTEHTLYVGAEMPLGSNRAARTGGELVYVIPSAIANELEKDLSAWRSNRLIGFFATDVASLTVRNAEGRVGLARAGSSWTLTEPIADLADGDRVDGLVADISAAQIGEFVDAPGDLKALGLDPPLVEVTLVRKDGKPEVKLAFGVERDKDGAHQRACRRGDRVSWVGAAVTGKATTSPVDWRSKKLVSVETWSASKVELTKGNDRASLERKDGIWKVAGVEVDGEAVSRRLSTLADMTVTGFDKAKPAGAATGRIAVTAGDGGVIEATFYPGTSAGEAIAVVTGRVGALAIEGEKVGELLVDPASLAKPKPPPAAAQDAADESSPEVNTETDKKSEAK